MNLDNVYQKIYDNNINLYEHNIEGIKGLVIEANKQYNIFLNHDEIKDKDEEFCIATHEYGHCMSGATHKINSKLDVVARHEYRANRRAILDFLPLERLKQAINAGCQTSYEFSEYLDIPEAFVSNAFQHYSHMGLI